MKKLDCLSPGQRLIRSRGASRGLPYAAPVGFALFSSDDYEDASPPRIYDYAPRRSLAAADECPENVIRISAVGSTRRKA